jgi:hypothetical protein
MHMPHHNYGSILYHFQTYDTTQNKWEDPKIGSVDSAKHLSPPHAMNTLGIACQEE